MRTLRASLATAALVAVALFVPATASAAPITADDTVDIVTVVDTATFTDLTFETLAVKLNYGWGGF